MSELPVIQPDTKPPSRPSVPSQASRTGRQVFPPPKLPDWAQKLADSGCLGPGGMLFAEKGYADRRSATLNILDAKRALELQNTTSSKKIPCMLLVDLVSALNRAGFKTEAKELLTIIPTSEEFLELQFVPPILANILGLEDKLKES